MQIGFEGAAPLTPSGHDSKGAAPVGVNHTRGIDATAAGRIVARQNVRPVVECQPVDGDRSVNRGIDGQGDNQAIMLAQIRLLT